MVERQLHSFSRAADVRRGIKKSREKAMKQREGDFEKEEVTARAARAVRAILSEKLLRRAFSKKENR
jgi:hypothetical protein